MKVVGSAAGRDLLAKFRAGFKFRLWASRGGKGCGGAGSRTLILRLWVWDQCFLASRLVTGSVISWSGIWDLGPLATALEVEPLPRCPMQSGVTNARVPM